MEERSHDEGSSEGDSGSGDESMAGSSQEGDESSGSESGDDVEEDGSDDESDEDSQDGSDDSEEQAGSHGGAAPSKKAAAALVVGVGSFSDPPHLQGLSHLLEHMLFMGSDQFPDENEYDAFLTHHGGSSNAYTELEYTNYHFDVAPEHLRGALQRFSRFFVAPLVKPGSLSREVQAVDSEFAGVLQSDTCRLSQLMCHTAKPGHVFNKFSWGNAKSLWEQPAAAGMDVRSQLMEYYRAQYGAERMALALLGGQSLDTLEEWARELFSDVPGGCGPRASFLIAGLPFEGRHMYLAPAVKDHHEVTVTFQLPSLQQQYANKPDHYLSHLIGHEGPGSLLSALKARGWATELCAGVDGDGYSCNSDVYLFTVSITLTEAGLAAAPGLGLAPVALLFQILRLLLETGPQEWVWEELKSISDMRFRFQEEEEAMDYVTRLAATMPLVAPQHVLAADFLHEQWQPDMVLDLMRHMDPVSSSYRIDLMSRAFPQLQQQLTAQQQPASGDGVATGAPSVGPSDPAGTSGESGPSLMQLCGSAGVTAFTEPWFGMQAAGMQLPEELTRGWATAAVVPDLALPPKNPYLPSDFSLRHAPDGAGEGQDEQPPPQEAAAAAAPAVGSANGNAGTPGQVPVLSPPPVLLVDEPGLRVWHAPAARFSQPRALAFFRAASPAASTSARAAALTHLWLKLVEDALAEDAYLADVAGLHYSLGAEGVMGLEARVDGFSHKLPVLAARVFGCLARAEVREGAFSRVHEALVRKYRNMNLQVAKAATYARLYALSSATWHTDAVLAELLSVSSASEVATFAATFLSSLHLEALVVGNLAVEEALTLARAVRTTLATGGGVLGAVERPRGQCLELPAGVVVEHQEAAKNPEEDNCCVEVYYQVGPASDLLQRTLLDLVDQVSSEPAYDSLRTKQQLGYTVHSGARLTHGVLGFCVTVVSAAFPAQHVAGRIEAFMAEFEGTMAAMAQPEFERHVSALINNKLQQDMSLAHAADRAWEQVWSGRYEFHAREQEAQLLQTLTLTQLQAFYSAHLSPSSATRRTLRILVTPTSATAATAAAAGGSLAASGQQQQQLEGMHEADGDGGKKEVVAPAEHVLHGHPAKGTLEPHVAPQHPGATARAHGGGGGGAGKAAEARGGEAAAAEGEAAALAPVPPLPAGVTVRAASDLGELKASLPLFPVVEGTCPGLQV